MKIILTSYLDQNTYVSTKSLHDWYFKNAVERMSRIIIRRIFFMIYLFEEA